MKCLLCAEHKYPYDWRTKKPTIFRATEQWFASVEGFRQAAIDAISKVAWTPPQVLTPVHCKLGNSCVYRLRLFIFIDRSLLFLPL